MLKKIAEQREGDDDDTEEDMPPMDEDSDYEGPKPPSGKSRSSAFLSNRQISSDQQIYPAKPSAKDT